MGEIVGVVLAGGRGTRFEGGNKLLTTLDGQPIVSHAARTLDVEGIDHTIAVLGYDADRVRKAVSSDVDETVENPAYAEGQSRSVRVGAQAAAKHSADAVLFLPGDMPRVDPSTVTQLVAAFRESDETVVVPTYDGERGNPVLFGEGHFGALATLTGDTGGRTLFESATVRRVAVDDPGVHLDIDTVADRERIDGSENR
jgi:molybdenum cofactor cytidylyltransferase